MVIHDITILFLHMCCMPAQVSLHVSPGTKNLAHFLPQNYRHINLQWAGRAPRGRKGMNERGSLKKKLCIYLSSSIDTNDQLGEYSAVILLNRIHVAPNAI